jgi:FAD/FMN-containing dehydrogenase
LAQAGAAGLAASAAAALPAGLVRATSAAATTPAWPRGWLSDLAHAMRGSVITPTDFRYLATQALFNSRYDFVFPRAIARPVDAADVVAIMRWASTHDVPLAPRGGGHGYTGNATSADALVVDLRAIKGTQISADGRSAAVGGGSLTIDVVTALGARGLAVPTGTCPSVGITGLAMGGGIGSLARAHGLTADRVTGLTIVTPDGAVRRVDERNDPDLFWACRGGGGGNFGVVTELQLAPVEAVTETHVTIFWPWNAADEVLAAYLGSAADAPPELAGDLAITVGFGHWTRPSVKYTSTYLGTEAQARAALAPLLAVREGQVRVDVRTRQQSAMFDAHCTNLTVEQCRPYRFGVPGHLERSRFYAGSAYLGGPLDAAGRTALIEVAHDATPGFNGTRSIIIAAHGGAIASVAPDATAYPHRDAHYGIQFYAQSGGAWEDRNARDWVRAACATVEPVSTGAYVNYLDAYQDDWEAAYYGASAAGLRAVKAKYDPSGRFRPAQGVPLA